MKNGLHINKHGHKHWYLNDQKHCLDGPAVEWDDGAKSWYFDDEFLGLGDEGFWPLWDMLTDEQRNNINLLMHLPK